MLLVGPGSARALSITVSPAIVDVVVSPGETGAMPLFLTNQGAMPLEIRAQVWDFWHEDDKAVLRPPGSAPRSAAAWLDVVPGAITLAPGERAEGLRLLAGVPEDAEGGYYAAVVLEASRSTAGSEGAGMSVGGRLVVTVFLRAGDTGTSSMRIDDVRVEPPTSSAPLVLRVDAHTAGDVHALAQAEAIVLDAEGQVRGRITGPPARILPGQTRTLEARGSLVLEPGRYTALVSTVHDEGASSAEHAFTVGPGP